MPEGQETRTYADHIRERYKNHKLEEIYDTKRNPQISKQNWDLIKLPSKLINVESFGKKVVLEFENEIFVVISFGLTGVPKFSKGKFTDLIFTFENGFIYFDNKRKIGNIIVTTDLEEALKDVGPDWFDEVDYDLFHSILSTTIKSGKNKNQLKYGNKQICQILMDQKLMAGVGNYIKAEALYRNKMSPKRLIKDINDKEMKDLYDNIKDVMNESYKAGGYSRSDYLQPDGNKGMFKTEVYGFRNKNQKGE